MIVAHITNKVKKKKRCEGAKSRVQVLLPDSRHALIWHLASFATSLSVNGGGSRRSFQWSDKSSSGSQVRVKLGVKRESEQQSESNLFQKQSPGHIMIMTHSG